MKNSNKTFVTGMEHQSTNSFNPYSRTNISGKGTFVPGMERLDETQATPITNAPTVSTTPVVGFLYTISRGGVTEYWPIHVGANIIGRSSDCDIMLEEASVSERHAQINVRQMKVSKKLIANIQDIGSKNGMFLNEEELDYETHTCQNGDIVTIGNAYKMLLILIDSEAYGLKPSDNFLATESEEVPTSDLPNFGGDIYNMNGRDNNATVDLSGTGGGFAASGGTMIIEK